MMRRNAVENKQQFVCRMCGGAGHQENAAELRRGYAVAIVEGGPEEEEDEQPEEVWVHLMIPSLSM